VHEGGLSIERDFQHRWFFKRADGIAVPSSGYRAQDMIDDDIGDIDNTITELSNVFKNPSAEGFLATMETSRTEAPRLPTNL